jgi:hypothetical protein
MLIPLTFNNTAKNNISPLFALYVQTSKIKRGLIMKATPKKIEKSDYLVKLRIDKRTIILVRTPESLKNWKSKYPNAVEVL